MIQEQRSTLILFARSNVANDEIRGMARLNCGHSVNYRTKSPAFVAQLKNGWFLPCPSCPRDAA